jgi:hypothetical protein
LIEDREELSLEQAIVRETRSLFNYLVPIIQNNKLEEGGDWGKEGNY